MNPDANRRPRAARPMQGFSLVELMIAVVLGMIVIAGVIQVFVGSARSNTELLRMTRLEEELSAIMTLMSADIRRAGFNTAANNPGNVGAGWVNDMAPVLVTGDDCIRYIYDSEGNANAADINNRFGFRLNGSVIEMFTNQGDWTCGGANGWLPASSANVVTINDLEFALTEQCINATNNARTCAAGSALPGDTLVTTRFVDITLDGQLATDALVRRNLQESVRIRNDLITFVP